MNSVDRALVHLNEAKSLARQYAEDVHQRFGERVHAVRLYGSAARGDWSPESDIDVLVLLDSVTRQDSEWLVSHAVALGILGSGLLLQPLPMTAEQFNHLQARERRFAAEVSKEGIDL